MIKKGWQQLRQQKKNGISMAVVLCVSAFFVAFAAAILYTAGMLTAQSNLRLKQERCSQLAKSAADVLDQELQKYTNKEATVFIPLSTNFWMILSIWITVKIIRMQQNTIFWFQTRICRICQRRIPFRKDMEISELH